MNVDTCYCRNRDCRAYGRTGELSRLKFFDWHRGAPRFRCQICQSLVSTRAGTAYAGIRTDEITYRYAVTARAEGLAPRGRTNVWTRQRYVVQLVASAR